MPNVVVASPSAALSDDMPQRRHKFVVCICTQSTTLPRCCECGGGGAHARSDCGKKNMPPEELLGFSRTTILVIVAFIAMGFLVTLAFGLRLIVTKPVERSPAKREPPAWLADIASRAPTPPLRSSPLIRPLTASPNPSPPSSRRSSPAPSPLQTFVAKRAYPISKFDLNASLLSPSAAHELKATADVALDPRMTSTPLQQASLPSGLPPQQDGLSKLSLVRGALVVGAIASTTMFLRRR